MLEKKKKFVQIQMNQEPIIKENNSEWTTTVLIKTYDKINMEELISELKELIENKDWIIPNAKYMKRKPNGMENKYVIIDLRNMDYMKDENGKINYYDTEEEACLICGMYEFENTWVMKLIFNYIE